ncbi:MAG: HAD hydrolase-like protein [Legionellales bacterium]|nr:HAD hydrolase-like protein [Legionellales bacterium]
MPLLMIFDWDGTLADSVNAIVSCKHSLAAQHHLPPPQPEVIKQVLGMNFEEAMTICFPTATPSLFAILCREFQQLIQDELYQARLFPQVKEMLFALKTKNIKLAVATSKSRVALNKALIDTGLSDNVFE